MTIIDAKLTFNSNHTDRKGAPTGIVLHHPDAKEATVEAIHRWHKDGNGWAGIGYHFYVRKDGTVYRGRSETWMGAHTVGHNDKLGVCAEGDFDVETMPAVQQTAIVELLQYLFGKYGEMNVYRHRDLDNTACPGKNYPFDAIVKAAKSTGTELAAEGINWVLEFQKAAVADGVELPQYGADGIWGNETAGAAKNLLVYGSRGERVRVAQKRLIALGYDLGTAAADGIFGQKTFAAVKAFQAKKVLVVDGKIGLNTTKALYCE